MPYDETILKRTIINLQLKISSDNVKLHEENEFLKSLILIRDVKFTDIIDGKRVDRVEKPIDSGTGKDIADARRNQIFDSLIPKVKALLK